MIQRLVPLMVGVIAFGSGLGGGPVSYDETARFGFGGRPLGLLLHLGVISAVFEMCRRRAGRTREALWAALLFAALPATSEAVLGLQGRGAQLSTLLVLIGMTMHAAGGPLLSLRLALVQGLALLLHPTAAALAPLILVHDALLVRRPVADTLQAAGGAMVVTVAMLIVQATPGDLGDILAVAPFMAEGLGRTLVPHTLTISWVPDRPSVLFSAALTLASALVAVGVVSLRRRHPNTPRPGLFGLGWWGFATLPLVPIALSGQPVAEGGLYLAIVGPCIWLGRSAADFLDWFSKIGRGRLANGLLIAVITLLCARSALRAQDWRDDFLLHLSAVEDEPSNAEALYRYGTHLARHGERLSSARSLSRAYEVSPERVDVANNFAVTLMYRSEWAMAETLLRSALARAPDHPTLAANLEQLVARTPRGARLIAP